MPGLIARTTRFADNRAHRPLVRTILPGLGLALGVSVLAVGLEQIERFAFGAAPFESLVIAILLGTLIRSLFVPGRAFAAGISFSAHTVLEWAIVLLGASVSFASIGALGPNLLLTTIGIVIGAIIFGYLISRALGLEHRLAILVAGGNAICGNSAIAALSPTIGASSEQTSAAIAFTAVLGIVVVVFMPVVGTLLGLSPMAYGVFSGLTVYAVPQVLAAASPMGAVAIHMGTLVKLMRVIMLGPVVLVAGVLAGADRPESRMSLSRYLPWYIIGFFALMAARSFGVVPEGLADAMSRMSGLLTILAMAGLGLGVDIRQLASSGGRVILAASLSLILLASAATLVAMHMA